ncbi:MAG: FtsW/RodA/SpoVE family cell cycle protein [Candidatus Obscuribacter sp.]|nr:FtsW/RodA/SpoVE family cell cycle protein [Candidatus Obscuribacter sp.]
MPSRNLSTPEPSRWQRRRKGAPPAPPTQPSAKEFRGGIDRTLVAITLSLCGFGLMAVYSASAPEAQNSFQDSTTLLRKQSIAFVLGLFTMFSVSRYDYRRLKKLACQSPLARSFCSVSLLCQVFQSPPWVPAAGWLLVLCSFSHLRCAK